LLLFLPSPCKTCTVHVSAGEAKLVTVLMHSNQLMWAGLGWAQPVDLGPSPVQLNNGGSGPAQQIYIYIILWFPRVLFYVILFNIGL
jgi:hypothetical protein